MNERLKPNYRNVWLVGGAMLARDFIRLNLTDEVGWSELILAVAGVMAIAVIMIGTHTLKVSQTNPDEVLKSE